MSTTAVKNPPESPGAERGAAASGPPEGSRPTAGATARGGSTLTSKHVLWRGMLTMLAIVCGSILLNLAVYSHVQHAVAQQRLSDTFRAQLAEGTAPVAEGDFNDVLLPDGAPVARIQIPVIGVNETVVEGTSSSAMREGPGHRRDTILPGQRGTSIIMGRMGAYGGPFSRIHQLAEGDEINVVTGQGEMKFKVVGVRYAGDAAPGLKKGGARLQLLTAGGPWLMPNKLVRVDADLEGEGMDTGLRQTGYLALPHADRPMASDARTAWALVFALQFILVAEVGFLWAWRKLGPAKAWIMGIPVLLLAALLVGDQIARLLPNLT